MRQDIVHALGGPPRRIAVLRALQLGDLVCAVPALRALRHGCPQASIALVGLPWAKAFVARFSHLVDRFVEFPGFPGFPEREPDLDGFPAFVAWMQDGRYDLVLQMHGRGDASNALALLLGGRITCGFHPAGGWCPDSRRFVCWPETGTEIEKLLALTDFLGIERRGGYVEFPVTDDERAGARSLLCASGLAPDRLVILHPGARMPSRRWPPGRFGRLGALLAAAGWQVAVTGSGEDERAICDAVVRESSAALVNLHGQTTLGTLAGLVEAARLVVCNDTGVSHVAAGCGTPSVIVSCGADPTRFAPPDRARHRVLFHMTECRPCMHPVCPFGHPCANELTLDTVADASFAQLRDFAPARAAAALAG